MMIIERLKTKKSKISSDGDEQNPVKSHFFSLFIFFLFLFFFLSFSAQQRITHVFLFLRTSQHKGKSQKKIEKFFGDKKTR